MRRLEHGKPVHQRGVLAGNGRVFLRALLCDVAHRAGSVIEGHPLPVGMCIQKPGALGEPLGMGEDPADVLHRGSGQADEVVHDPDLLLAHDVEVGIAQEKVVVLVDGSRQGVLDGHHAEARLALQHRVEHGPELRHGLRAAPPR